MSNDHAYKHLYRSKDNRVFAGLLGGVGEYFNVDPVLLRVFWIVMTVFSGVIPGVLTYFFAFLVVPEHP